MTDVDVNERLNGLVNLLHVVGIDGVDPDALVAEQKKLQRGSSNSTPTTTQSADSQILELIKKLQLAQADSPEILAALNSPELRALASLAAQQQAKPEPKKSAAPSLEDVMDDDDNYPKIGPGYSDDISVVSDMSTPTVMTRQDIQEEEYYKEVNEGAGALPPMHVGGPAQPSRPPAAVGGPPQGGFVAKQKNLVSQVKPGRTRNAIAKSGGAAAQRRLNYQQAMAKLQSNEYGTPVNAKQDKNYMENFSPKKPKAAFFPTSPTPSKLPSELPSLADQGKKVKQTRNKTAVKEKKGKKTAMAAQEEADFELDYDPMAPKFDQFEQAAPSSGASHSSGGRKKKERPAASQPPVNNEIDWGGSPDAAGWPAFDGAKKDDIFVDNDGFFSSDVFGQPSAFNSATKSPSKVRRESHAEGSSRPRKPKKDGERKEKSKKPKSRRASLTM
jgi:hypothetical protein